MDIEEFVTPVSYALVEELHNGHNWSVGANTHFGVPVDLQAGDLCLLFVSENESLDEGEEEMQELRRNFYSMSHSNWSITMHDLGNLATGESWENTKFAAFSIAREVDRLGAKLIFIGGKHSMTYQLYLAIQSEMKSVCTIDSKIDLNMQSMREEDRFISDMILNQEHPLLDYVNLGSQAPFRFKEESDILEQMNFEEIRLGKLIDDITLAEPYIREIDLLSMDMKAMQHASFPGSSKPSPNGFNGREICQIMKYAGNSWQLRQMHIAEIGDLQDEVSVQLVAEMIWYFIEAVNNRQQDGGLEVYRVQFDEEEIVFYKSVRSGKWWVETLVDGMQKKIPCSHVDYKQTLQGELPDRWLKFFKKFY